MLVSGGSLVVTKRPDILTWRGRTDQITGAVAEILGGWTSYVALYERQPWINAAVKKLASATGRLPLKTYQRTATGRDDARDTPYGQLLRRPNKRIDPVTLWRWVSSTEDIFGESFLGKVRDAGGRPVELVPLHPTWMHYDTSDQQWSVDDGKRRFDIDRRDFIHFRYYAPNGVRGLSPLEPLRSTLENEEGARRANSAMWRNGGRPSVVLSHPRTLSDPAAERIAASWADIHGGVDNWAKAAVLEEGMTATVLPLNVEELQYIEARKLNREEVCGVYDIPPPVLHILDRATFSNITEQLRSMYRDTMAPRIGAIESTLEHELRDGRMGANVEPDFPDNLYAEFLMDEVLRGDFEVRVNAWATAINTGQVTPDEARRAENRPFVEGSDKLLINAALVPVGQLGQAPPEQLALPAPKAFEVPVDLRSLMGRLSRAKTLNDIDAVQLVAGIDYDHGKAILAELDAARLGGESLDQFKARLRALTEA